MRSPGSRATFSPRIPNIATIVSSPPSIATGKIKATFSLAYIVRAVTPGHYLAPPATIEDMYRPQRYGRTAYGTLDVSAAK